jgi:hypothetical protein
MLHSNATLCEIIRNLPPERPIRHFKYWICKHGRVEEIKEWELRRQVWQLNYQSQCAPPLNFIKVISQRNWKSLAQEKRNRSSAKRGYHCSKMTMRSSPIPNIICKICLAILQVSSFVVFRKRRKKGSQMLLRWWRGFKLWVSSHPRIDSSHRKNLPKKVIPTIQLRLPTKAFLG